MIEVFAPDAVRAMDARAFERGVTGDALMDRAAGHLARGVLSAAGRAYGLRVAVLAGTGNNGGDGLAAARRLRDAGAFCEVVVVGDADRLSADAARELERWRAVGGRQAHSVAAAVDGADVVVDCLLGTGTRGAPREPHASAIADCNAARAPVVVACDIPSGIDAATGQVPAEAVRADCTVTMGAHKVGLWLWPARAYAGRVILGELGIVERADQPAARVMEPADVAAALPEPPPDVHKRSRGVVVLLAGSDGMTGAATLCARGAMAAGAGLVTVAISPSGRRLVAPTIPEALSVEIPPDDPDEAFGILAEQLDRADAVGLGPGLGRSPETLALIRRIVREVALPMVVDADGLNAFAGDAAALAEHAAPQLVLTPHAGEFARLAGSDAWPQRITAVPDAARAWRATVVAKGPGTLVAAPHGRVWINPTGGAALATGGTGDVLTGMLTALLAQRPDPERVAAGVYVHGLAGAVAGRAAARSVTALDVAAAVPRALAEVER